MITRGDVDERLVVALWLRWTSLARVVEAANVAGISDPLERYRFIGQRVHGLSGARLDDFVRLARTRLAEGSWQPIPDRLAPEDVLGAEGAALLRDHGLCP